MPEAPRAEVTGHIVLVGMTGSGKTSVAPLVADWLERPVVDSDALVVAETRRTVREIFAEDGEAAFRAIEEGAVVDALLDPTPSVLALGGGAILSATTRAALAEGDHCVVWLRGLPATLARNLNDADDRPLLHGADDLEERLTEMLAIREVHYADVADLVVDVEDRTADEVAAAVLAAVIKPDEAT
jgi:shikimate kinase